MEVKKDKPVLPQCGALHRVGRAGTGASLFEMMFVLLIVGHDRKLIVD